MSPVMGETAVIGLVIGNTVPSLLLGALFLSRIWKVSTASKPKAAKEPEASVVTAAETIPFADKRIS